MEYPEINLHVQVQELVITCHDTVDVKVTFLISYNIRDRELDIMSQNVYAVDQNV